MLVIVEPLATVPNRPNEVRKARLQAPQRYLNTSSDRDIVKTTCRVAVELIRQTLADLRPSILPTMNNMNYSMISAIAIGYCLRDADIRPESTITQGSILLASGLLFRYKLHVTTTDR